MAVNEQIVTGRKFRKLIDEANKIWQRISFWTKSSDVEFEDGKNAETKLGAINGITSDLSCEESTIAASAAALNQVNRSLGGNIITYENGKYYIQAGADTASKKQLGSGGDVKIVSLPKSSSINIKSYTDNWAELTNANFSSSVAGKVGGLSLNHTYGSETTYNGMNFIGYTAPTVSHSYNATTGTLTVSIKNGTFTLQPWYSGLVRGTITGTITAVIGNVYMYLSE